MPYNHFTVGAFEVYAVEAQHDAAEPLAFLIRHKESGDTLFYATDTFMLNATIKQVNVVLVECNYCFDIARSRYISGELPVSVYARLMTSHFSLEHLKDWLRLSDLSETHHIILVHLSEGNSDAERMKREISELTGIPTTAAEAGLTVDLPERLF